MSITISGGTIYPSWGGDDFCKALLDIWNYCKVNSNYAHFDTNSVVVIASLLNLLQFVTFDKIAISGGEV